MCLTILDEKKKRATVGYKVVQIISGEYRNVFPGKYGYQYEYVVGKTSKADHVLEGIYFYLTLKDGIEALKIHRKAWPDKVVLLKVSVKGVRETGTFNVDYGVFCNAGHCDEIKVLKVMEDL